MPLTATLQPDGESRPPLNPSQEFRVHIARKDLERARQMDLGSAPPAELVLILGALVSSLYNLLAVLADVTAEPGTGVPVQVCDYCRRPAGSPRARRLPGDPASPLVGITHDACWKRFLAEQDPSVSVRAEG